MEKSDQTISDDKIRAEIAKLVAETMKINTENRWYPAVVGAAGMAAALAIAKLFL